MNSTKTLFSTVISSVCLASSSFAFSTADLTDKLSLPSNLSMPSMDFLKKHEARLSLGGYFTTAGKSSFVYINDMIGSKYTNNNHTGSNGLIGAGFFVSPEEFSKAVKSDFYWGIEAFWLPKVGVSGDVISENIFKNYAYNYNISNFPVYVSAKTTFNQSALFSEDLALSLIAGLGINFMNTYAIEEHPLDQAAVANTLFLGEPSTHFSVTAGAGITTKKPQLGGIKLDVSYRFFYLGQDGSFRINNTQVVNAPTTGTVYGNAIMVTFIAD